MQTDWHIKRANVSDVTSRIEKRRHGTSDSSSANTDSHSPAMTTTVTKRYFSQMKTQADLEETFGCTYGLQIESSPPRLGVFALRRELLGEDSGDQEWEKASEMYRAFF